MEKYEEVPPFPKYYFKDKNIYDIEKMIENVDVYKKYIVYREGLLKPEVDFLDSPEPYDEEEYLLFESEIIKQCQDTCLSYNPKFSLQYMDRAIGVLRLLFILSKYFSIFYVFILRSKFDEIHFFPFRVSFHRFFTPVKSRLVHSPLATRHLFFSERLVRLFKNVTKKNFFFQKISGQKNNFFGQNIVHVRFIVAKCICKCVFINQYCAVKT